MENSVGGVEAKDNWIDRLAALWRGNRLRSLGTIGLVALAPILALGTYLVLGPLGEVTDSPGLRLMVLADLVYILVVSALVLREVARIVASRRAQSAGSKLHLRLTAIFTFVALAPTVLVAVLAFLSVNMGLEGWFSDRVSTALGNSVDAAVAYQQEHRDDLAQDARALANYIDISRRAVPFISEGDLRQVLSQGQGQIQRGLREAFILDGSGEIPSPG